MGVRRPRAEALERKKLNNRLLDIICKESEEQKCIRFGNSLRTLRCHYGFSLGDVSRETGLTLSDVSILERGKGPVDKIVSVTESIVIMGLRRKK
jgi:hypothetical protein